MTDIGEGVAVETVTEKKPGELRVQVRDICDGKLIEGAEVSIGSDRKKTDDSGEISFEELPAGAVAVQARKHFEESDYSKFVIHYPRLMRDFEAKSMTSDSVQIESGGKAKIRLHIEVYKVLEEVVFHRRHIDIGGEDKYGHWWSVFSPTMSFGWWPKYPLGHPNNRQSEPPERPEPLPADAGWRDKISHQFSMARYNALSAIYEARESGPSQTFRGVEGELNGTTSFGGDAEPGRYLDPHHKSGDAGDEQYSPVRKDCFDLDTIKRTAENFAVSYEGGWSWRFEAGNHCHTFQKQLMKEVNSDKVRVIR